MYGRGPQERAVDRRQSHGVLLGPLGRRGTERPAGQVRLERCPLERCRGRPTQSTVDEASHRCRFVGFNTLCAVWKSTSASGVFEVDGHSHRRRACKILISIQAVRRTGPGPTERAGLLRRSRSSGAWASSSWAGSARLCGNAEPGDKAGRRPGELGRRRHPAEEVGRRRHALPDGAQVARRRRHRLRGGPGARGGTPPSR